jgi:Zn-dependent protease with chaperone function
VKSNTSLHQNGAVTTHRLVPWLWFWLVVYLLGLPDLARYSWLPKLADLFSAQTGLLQGLNPLSRLNALSGILELAPMLAVFLGVLTLLFPHLRAWLIERAYALSEPEGVPAIQEMRAFIAAQMPNARLRANLRRFDQPAFTYPLGYRTCAVAVFGGLALLWRKDRPAAEAILLHEIAHCRHGDVLIVGAGSLFQWLANRWVWIYLALGLLPMLLAGGYELWNTWQQLRSMYTLSLLSSAELARQFFSALWLILSGELIIAVYLMLYTAWVFILPLMGIWSAELNADRFVCENLRSADEVSSALARLQRQKRSIRERILGGMSHPPAGLRAWAARNYQNSTCRGALALLFPAAYLGKLILNIAMVIVIKLPVWDARAVLQTLVGGIQAFFHGTAFIWLAMLLLILVWPFLSPYWEWFFSGQTVPQRGSNTVKM